MHLYSRSHWRYCHLVPQSSVSGVSGLGLVVEPSPLPGSYRSSDQCKPYGRSTHHPHMLLNSLLDLFLRQI